MKYYIKLNNDMTQDTYVNTKIEVINNDGIAKLKSLSVDDFNKVQIFNSIEYAIGFNIKKDMKVFEIIPKNIITKNNETFCTEFEIVREIKKLELSKTITDPMQACMWALKISAPTYITEKFKNDNIWSKYFISNKA